MEITRKHSSDFTRLFDILTYQKEKYANAKALNAFEGNALNSYSIENIIEQVDALSCWFFRNGYTRGQKILLMPVMGTPQWMIIDFACQQCGLITVPVHPTSSPQDFELIIKETEATLCITADSELLGKVTAIARTLGSAMRVYHLEKNQAGYFEPIASKTPSDAELTNLTAIKSTITENDLTTILYTSGSSGVPKGVLLTHRNVVYNIKVILTLLPLEPYQKVISFLPFSHILERMACYGYLAFGVSLYFSQSKETFARDFKRVRPYFAPAFRVYSKRCMTTCRNSCWIKIRSRKN
jgi:long-chain acyl-CoA synthetase